MRILIEPRIQQAITLAARRKGMRAGDLARRLLTAISTHDLIDAVLDAKARSDKVGVIEAAKPVPVEEPPKPALYTVYT
jgi:hypothetical protein